MTDPALEALWKNVLDHWDEDQAHGAFLDHCQNSDQLVEAAVRYRGMSGDHERGEGAKKRLQGVAILAMAKLETQRSNRPRPRRGLAGWVVVAFFLTASALLLVYLGGLP